MAANDKQVAGDHYGHGRVKTQHWDIVVEHDLNYFEAQILRYTMRCRKKAGKVDLEKAKHFIEKYLEVYDDLVKQSVPERTPAMPRPISADMNYTVEGFKTDDTELWKCRQCRTEEWRKNGAPGTALGHTPTCPLNPANQGLPDGP